MTDAERKSMIANQFEQMVNGNLSDSDWTEPDIGDASTIRYLSFIKRAGIKIKMLKTVLDGTYLFKLEWRTRPDVRYLAHDSKTSDHMWAGEGFHVAIDPEPISWQIAKDIMANETT